MSSNISGKDGFVDKTKIGEHAAGQPLSGVGTVHQSGAVSGHGGGYALTTPQNDNQTKEKPL